MTPDERSTERIRTWLADTADELGDPTRGVNDVIVRLSATPQRRRWRAWPWARGASSTEQLGGDHLATHGRSSGRLGLAGLAILAIEFAWARRLLAFTRARLEIWWRWLAAQHVLVRLVLGVALFVFVVGVIWLTLTLTLGVAAPTDIWDRIA